VEPKANGWKWKVERWIHSERSPNSLRPKNEVDARIALIGRLAQMDHVGEYIASKVFGIALEHSAANKGNDGRFISGPLDGKTVNIKWYGKAEGMLDMNASSLPYHHLVLRGPRANAASSRGLCVHC